MVTGRLDPVRIGNRVAIADGIVSYMIGFIPIAGATIGAIITVPFLIIAYTLL